MQARAEWQMAAGTLQMAEESARQGMVKLLVTHPSKVNKNTTGFSAPTLTTIMADPNIIGPQPDAGRIVQHFHGLAEELSKLSNVPALTEGNLIQHAVAQLTDQIQQSNVQINAQFNAQFTQFNAQFNAQIAQINAQFAQRFDQLDNKIDTLTTRVIAK